MNDSVKTQANAPTEASFNLLQPASAKSQQSNCARLLVQRKCACGSNASGLTGKCEECGRKGMFGLQTKLAVSEPSDHYEQEADRIADKVMRMPVPMLQRQIAHEEEEEEEQETLQAKPLSAQITPLLQRQPVLDEDDEEEEEAVQAKASGTQAPVVTPDLQANIQVLRQGGGQPLDPPTRAFMEPRFGHDFSGVRIHSDSRAADTCRLINARAFTIGENIGFAPGQYDPESTPGRRLLAHELTHVVQQSIASKPTDSSGNVFRALTEPGTNDGNSAKTTEDVDNARKATKCSDEAVFSLQKLTPRLEPDKRAVQLNADKKLIIPNIVFELNATVRADKHKRIKDSQVRQWKFGIIQNVHRSRAQLDYSDPQNRDNLIDCGLSDQKETHIDCDNGKPWYNPPKRAFVRFPRFLHMSDRPQLEEVDLVNAQRSVLRRVQRDFKASTFVVAEKNNSFCVLSRVDWGFNQNDFFTPHVDVTQSGVSPVGVGKIEKNLRIDKPVEHGPDSGAPLTSGECPPQPPFGECPEEIPEQESTSQTPQSTQPPQVGTNAGSAARVECRTARPRFEGDYIQRPSADISSTTPILQRKTDREPDTARSLDEDSGVNESGVSSRSALKEQIQSYQNTCAGIASVKCVNGEIVEDLPECVEEAPCGVAECVKQHELSHAADITMLFQSRLGRHPCKHQDGTPFADGFNAFGDDFVSETGEDRTWNRFLLRSERKAYGVGVKCLREMRRNSKERLCKRLLTLEAAKSAWSRFLAAIGINPGV